MALVDYVYSKTQEYINSVSKAERKEIGQFFTPPAVASFMGNLMEFEGDHIDILDAGSGSGILSTALIEKIMNTPNIKSVYLCSYENNESVFPILQDNMDYIKELLKNEDVKFEFVIKKVNFILDNISFWRGELGSSTRLYDVIISNPPYKKIGKADLESEYMTEVVHGQPNIYFLFMSMSAKLLKNKGQMIFINPRSFTSGAYFQKFRKWFFNTVKLNSLHLFISRGDVFENVLQETIILKAVKIDNEIEYVNVSESESMDDFQINKNFKVPYKTLLDIKSKDCFLHIPTNEKDIEVLNFVNNWKENLISLGYRLKTGPVVDFRATQFLRDTQGNDTVPLFWPYNYKYNRIIFPVCGEKKPQFIISSEESKSLLVDNKNYLFVKRFTSKEEKRRLQAVIYLAKDMSEYNLIGIENHSNYITKLNGTMIEEELFGLFVIINSTILDNFFRILNGSTQVNANEMNSIPFPSKEEIIEFGKMIMGSGDLSVENCDKIIENKLNK